MAKQRDLGKEQFWRQVLAQHRRSGLTVLQFCAERGLSGATFYGWQRELKKRDAQATAFVPVRVVTDDDARGNANVEIVLTAGRRLRVGPGFDPQTLAQVLDVLEGRSC